VGHGRSDLPSRSLAQAPAPFWREKGVQSGPMAPATSWSMASASIPAWLSPFSTNAARSPRSRALARRVSFIPYSRRLSTTTGSSAAIARPVRSARRLSFARACRVTSREADAIALSHDELRERMSGNLCRCGAYNSIVDAIHETFGDLAAPVPKREADEFISVRARFRCVRRFGGRSARATAKHVRDLPIALDKVV
jgi:hypothetical protein